MHVLLHDPCSFFQKADLDLSALVACIAEYEDIPASVTITLSCVNKDTIAIFNKKYRGIDHPTDVLSFEDDLALNDLTWFSSHSIDSFHLGDILISPEIAQEQSIQYGISLKDEVALLIVHGVLHLVGWDHEYDEEAEEMEARETAILSHVFNKPFTRKTT